MHSFCPELCVEYTMTNKEVSYSGFGTNIDKLVSNFSLIMSTNNSFPFDLIHYFLQKFMKSS